MTGNSFETPKVNIIQRIQNLGRAILGTEQHDAGYDVVGRSPSDVLENPHSRSQSLQEQLDATHILVEPGGDDSVTVLGVKLSYEERKLFGLASMWGNSEAYDEFMARTADRRGADLTPKEEFAWFKRLAARQYGGRWTN